MNAAWGSEKPGFGRDVSSRLVSPTMSAAAVEAGPPPVWRPRAAQLALCFPAFLWFSGEIKKLLLDS